MAAAGYNTYGAKKDQGEIEPRVNITNQAPRMIFGNVDNWVKVDKTNSFKDADPTDPGIFTRGQFICIGVTLIEMEPGAEVWTKARMAHISSSQALMIQNNDKGFYTGYQGIPSNSIYAQISSKEKISVDQIVGFLRANLKDLTYDHIWSYTADVSPMSAAVSREGRFGEPPAN